MRDTEYLCKPCGRGEVLLKHIGPETRKMQKIERNKWKLTGNKRNSENKIKRHFLSDGPWMKSSFAERRKVWKTREKSIDFSYKK